MNREYKREIERQRKRHEQDEEARALKESPEGPSGERTGPRQFLREVRGELKRVNWPSRKEVASYSLVVLVAVSIVMLYVFGLDQAFGQLVFWMFG